MGIVLNRTGSAVVPIDLRVPPVPILNASRKFPPAGAAAPTEPGGLDTWPSTSAGQSAFSSAQRCLQPRRLHSVAGWVYGGCRATLPER
jgi:hypothetical protein